MTSLLLVVQLAGATPILVGGMDGGTEYNAPDRSLPFGYHDTGKTVTIYEVKPCDPKYPLQEEHWEADHDKGRGFWNHACYRRTGLTRKAMIVRWGEKPKKGGAKAITPEDNPRTEQVAERCPARKCNRWAVPVGVETKRTVEGWETRITYVCAKRHVFTLTPSGERTGPGACAW